MKLGLYALRDSQSGEFFSPACSFSDNSLIKMYKEMSLSLLKENDSVRSRMLDSQIYKLGFIDMATGVVESNICYLCNLIDCEDIVKNDSEVKGHEV